MARVLLTGATGFVGGRVARRLRQRGDSVLALARTSSDELAALGVTQIEGDLAALSADDLAGADAVVHAAATTGPDLATARAANRDGTRSVVDAAVTAGTPRLVHVSTTAVYDQNQAGEVVTEDAPLVTDGSPYAVTKVEAEAEAARGLARGLSVAVLRPPSVLGAGSTSTWGARMPRRARDGTLPARPSTGTFAFVHVEDLVDAVLAGIDHHADVTANVVGGHVDWRVYVDAIRALFADAPPAPPASGTAWRGRYDTQRLPAALGATPIRSFEDGLAEIAAWWHDGGPPA